jgi:hypothetical protein
MAGRRIEVSDLVGAEEIAERLGYAHVQTVHTLRRRHADFPEPIKKLQRTMIWSWREVEAWAKRTGRLK